MAKTVSSTVTGVVAVIEARTGAELKNGDPIAYLESMKMEIPVVMPQNGRLSEILIAEGDLVDEGQAIAKIE